MITENIRKITAGVDSRTISKVALLLKSSMVVGAALVLGLLISETDGPLLREFLKALSIALGLCILAIMHKRQTSNQ